MISLSKLRATHRVDLQKKLLIPCSAQSNFQNSAPIWLPHCPTCGITCFRTTKNNSFNQHTFTQKKKQHTHKHKHPTSGSYSSLRFFGGKTWSKHVQALKVNFLPSQAIMLALAKTCDLLTLTATAKNGGDIHACNVMISRGILLRQESPVCDLCCERTKDLWNPHVTSYNTLELFTLHQTYREQSKF